MFNSLFEHLLFFREKTNAKRIILKKNISTSLFVLFLLSGSCLFAQSKTISGTVTAEDIGGPVPGASVLVKGTTNGTSTDFDGNYSLTVSGPNAILVVSYLGYATQEIKIGDKTTINVVLKPSQEALDEVVVIGYGTARKSDLTGSVVTVSGNDLKEQNISNVAETLTGRLAGVEVLSTEGSPDAEVQIKVRGTGSITQDSSPLIIVDGFPINNLSDISPSDIANISVLKDASSTAIYGSRGANGVVIITTKSGREGKISVNFNTFYGVKKIANTIDVLSPEDFVKWQYEYWLLNDEPQIYEENYGLYQDYDQYIGMKGNDWQDLIYGRTGEVESRDLSIRGGSEKINFNFNYALYDEKAIMVGSNFKRQNLSLALKSKASDRVNLTFNARYSDTEINGGGANEQNEVSSADSRLKHSIRYSPIPLVSFDPTNTEETFFSDLVNPFVAVDDNQRRQSRKNLNLSGSFEWEVIDNLKFQTSLTLNNRNDLDYRFYGKSTYFSSNRPAVENQGLPSLVIRDRKREDFRNANTINYNFKNHLGDDHGLQLLVGQEMIIAKNNQVTSELHGFPSAFDFNTSVNLTTQGTPFSVNNFYSPEDKLLSFFGRANYDYKNKYLLTATYRIDGSSKFLGDNRWGYFPSAAFAWKVSEEEFLQNTDWLNSLKLRLSYGEAGNNNIPTGQTIQTFQSYNTSYINGIDNYWAASNVLANPDLKWETTVTQNIGLDYSLFNGRLSGSFELYKNVTKDLLLAFRTPGSGYEYQFRNIGEIQNTGFEALINYSAINKENYGLDLSFNISANTNKINSLGELEDFGWTSEWASSQIGNDYLVQVGSPLGIMYGYKSDGRYEVSDFDYDSTTGEYTLRDGVVDNSAVIGDGFVRPGALKLKDINGDGVVDNDDNTVIGDANPDFTGGMTLSARAYGFDFTAAFNWSVGFDVYNANKIHSNTPRESNDFGNLTTEFADGVRWTNLDPSSGQLVTDPSQLEALNANTTMWSPYMQRYVFSDWAVEDGTYLRLNTLTLGYTLPESAVGDLGITKLRLYVTANNVFVWTNYSGIDPEVSTRRKTTFTPRVDYSAYPRSRQVAFGLNLNF